MDDVWKKKLKLRLPVLLWLMLTLLFWGNYDRYEPVSDTLLEFPDLGNAFNLRGEVSQSNGVIRLHVPAGGKTAEARFRIAENPGFPLIRLSGRIRTEGVVRGKYRWNAARLLLIQRDTDHQWIPGTHGLLDEDGTVAWTPQVQEFEVFPEAAFIEVVLQQTGKRGTAWFDDISATPMIIKPSFVWFRALFGVIWLGMGLLYFKRCRLHRRKLRILILVNAMAILYGTLIPTEWIQKPVDHLKERLQQPLEHQVQEKKPPVSNPKPAAPSKPRVEKSDLGKMVKDRLAGLVEQSHTVGHFVLFATLCFLVYCSAALERQGRSYYFKVAFDVLLFAAATESLQFLTMDRTPGFADWLIDIFGMLSALILFLGVRLLLPVFPKAEKA
mgnify:CR=1 FL=1